MNGANLTTSVSGSPVVIYFTDWGRLVATYLARCPAEHIFHCDEVFRVLEGRDDWT